MSSTRKKEIYVYIILAIITLPIIAMYIWLFLSSFDIGAKGSTGATLENWSFLFKNIVVAGGRVLPSIWKATANTVIFAAGVTLLEIAVATLAGYVLSRMDFPGRKFLLRSTIMLHAFPSVTLLIAVYYVLTKLNLVNTLLGVVLVKTAIQIPMSTYILKGFFDDVSWDLEWSAMLDGCSRLETLYKIILPQVKPGIASASIFSFLSGWSEFILLYTLIFNNEKVTLATYLKSLIGNEQIVDYGVLSAVALFYLIPVILFFIFTQKNLMQVDMGGKKGV